MNGVTTVVGAVVFMVAASAAPVAPAASVPPANFLHTSADEVGAHRAILQRSDIEGVQVVYNWKRLEPREGQYDFSRSRQTWQWPTRCAGSW